MKKFTLFTTLLPFSKNNTKNTLYDNRILHKNKPIKHEKLVSNELMRQIKLQQ